MFDGSIHIHVLQVHLLVRDDYVDVVLTPQTVISDGQKRVHIRRKINARYIGALVHNHVKEPWILVSKAVMVLTPDGGGNQKV